MDLCTRSRSPPSVGLQGGFSDQPVTPLLPREGSACLSWGSRAPKPIYLSFPKSRMGWKEAWPWIPCFFSKPDHHAFTRLHSTQIPERKCCMKSMLSLVTIYHDGKIQMFQCLSLQFEWEFHNQSHKETNYTNHFILAPFGFDRQYQHKLTHISMSRVPRSKQFFEKNYVPVQKKDWAVTVGL